MLDKVFKPSVEMTFATAESDRERLFKHCHNSKDSLTLDLSEINHCDSAGLALLIEAKRLCAEQKKLCKIISMPKSVYALAKFCGVDNILELSKQ